MRIICEFRLKIIAKKLKLIVSLTSFSVPPTRKASFSVAIGTPSLMSCSDEKTTFSSASRGTRHFDSGRRIHTLVQAFIGEKIAKL